MAKNKSTVYLGYEDEEVTAKQEQFLNSCTNKIGGTPVRWAITRTSTETADN